MAREKPLVVGDEFGCNRMQVIEALGLDMPSLMLPSFPDLSLLLLGLVGRWEKCWRLILLPPAPGTFPQLRGHSPERAASPCPTLRHTEGQGPSRPAGRSLPAVQDHSVRARRESRASTALLQQRQSGSCPFVNWRRQIPHGSMPSPHGASLFCGLLVGMLGAERALGSLWSPFPAFYSSGGS